jgi:histidyl-tRNA synthetase
LKGFRDYLPEAMLQRERLMETARRVYRSYGFAPIDTPALEYLEILTGKGSEETDKQLFRFQHGRRWVGLRFDLTVPLARFAAQHQNDLGMPLKRYHIAPVWRGENTQRGRYREFVQCDFDTIGTEAIASDIETALVIYELFSALDLNEVTIRVNNRKVLNGILQRLDLAQQSVAVLRALDKLAKIGPEKVLREMLGEGIPEQAARDVLQMAAIEGTNDQILQQLEPLVAGSEIGQQGLAELAELLAATQAAGVDASHLKLDVAIARGLDYYTGTIYETFLNRLSDIGSVCSGGRYDNLAELYTTQRLPGVGASLGLDRLLAALEELGLADKVSTPASVFVPYFDPDRLHDYLRMASQLRSAGFDVELFHEPKRLGQQLKYADRRGFRVAVIAGSDEFESQTCQVKDLSSGQGRTVPLEADLASLIGALKQILSGG